jgi:hypothetical protein
MEENKKKLATYELIINDEDGTYVNFISLVKSPAIEVNWIAFSEDQPKKQKFKIQNAEKRMLSSAVMIPNMPIFRKNPDTGEEYFVVMTEETIEKAVKKFFKNGYTSNINQNHDDKVAGAYVIESWLTTGKDDKSKQYGFDLPAGSWFATVFIDNQEYWDAYIKTGELKGGGFSVEGMFTMAENPIKELQSEDFSKEEKEMIDELSKFFSDNEEEISKLL